MRNRMLGLDGWSRPIWPTAAFSIPREGKTHDEKKTPLAALRKSLLPCLFMVFSRNRYCSIFFWVYHTRDANGLYPICLNVYGFSGHTRAGSTPAVIAGSTSSVLSRQKRALTRFPQSNTLNDCRGCEIHCIPFHVKRVLNHHGKPCIRAEARSTDRKAHRGEPRQQEPRPQQPPCAARGHPEGRFEGRNRAVSRHRLGARQERAERRPPRQHGFAVQEPAECSREGARHQNSGVSGCRFDRLTVSRKAGANSPALSYKQGHRKGGCVASFPNSHWVLPGAAGAHRRASEWCAGRIRRQRREDLSQLRRTQPQGFPQHRAHAARPTPDSARIHHPLWPAHPQRHARL